MLRNYFITAVRNLKRNQTYTILNIGGLALGIGCALTLFKIITFELSFDTYHKNYERIYRLVNQEARPDGVDFSVNSPHPLGETFRLEFPEVDALAMTHYMYDGEFTITKPNGRRNIYLEDDGFVFAQHEIFRIFDFEWLAGDPGTALVEPNSVVITANLIKKYFNLDPEEADHAIGEVIRIAAKKDFVVTGVIRDTPLNTDFPFRVIASYNGQEGVNRYYAGGNNWRQSSSQTNCWITFKDGTDITAIERRLPVMVEKYEVDEDPQLFSYHLQSLRDIHFNTIYSTYTESSVSYEVLATLGVVGLFLVLTACINFINLATAQSVTRSKEIGLRKVMGGRKAQLIFQFLSETFIITLVSVLLALAVSEILLISLEDIITYRLRLDIFADRLVLLTIGASLFGVTLLAGLYPSFFIASFNPGMALKNRLSNRQRTGGGFGLRRALVIFQFGISQLLIIGTVIIGQQMDYLKNKDLGFKAGNSIILHLPEADSVLMERMRTRIVGLPYETEVSFSLGSPISGNNSYSSVWYPPVGDGVYSGNFKLVDENYLDYYDLQLLAGRNIRKGEPISNTVVNRRVLQMMGINEPDNAIGKTLESNWQGKKTIVGVVEDFHIYSLHDDLDYVLMLYQPASFLKCAVKVDPENTRVALADLEKFWQETYPQHLYDYSFYESDLLEGYVTEQAIFGLFRIFSLVAICIGCLGLYGLITFMTNQRIKEIGIRKVLGATISNILSIFTRELLILLAVAFVIAAPLSMVVMTEWLNDFHYSIGIGADVFLLSLLITLIISVMTMGVRSYRAATINPAESLKDE